MVLQVPAQQDAFGYQAKVSSLFNNGLQTAIEHVLDEMAAPGEVVRIDTLAVDLGVIEVKQFDAGFKAKLLSCLKEAVLKSKTGAVNDAASTKAETKPATTSQQDAFMYFVLHGSLPWFSNVKNMPVWEEALFTQWQPADWKQVATWVLDKQRQDGNAIQRIVLQFSNKFLVQLALHMYALQRNADSLAADTINAWHKDLATIASTIAADNLSAINTAIWLDLFETLAGNNAGSSSENIIACIIITQLQRAGQAAVLQAANNKSSLLLKVKTGVVHDAFSDIIAALQNKQPLDIIADYLSRGGNISTIYQLETDSNTQNPIVNNKNVASQTNKPTSTGNNKQVKAITAREDVLYLNNCGLVLLHPFLGAYFSDIGLIEKKQFVNMETQQRAVLLLHYLASSETEMAEFNLGLQKLLCGYPLENTLPASIELTEKEKYESEQLLRTVIDYWPPLKNTSVTGFQQTFLQREGRLSLIDSGWLLRVEQKAVDILLGKLPWGYSTIKLPWMAGMLNVEWA